MTLAQAATIYLAFGGAMAGEKRSFLELVRQLREAQKRFFRHRKQADLEESKRLKRLVDSAMEDEKKGPALFK